MLPPDQAFVDQVRGRYSDPSYDLVGAAPELACALEAARSQNRHVPPVWTKVMDIVACAHAAVDLLNNEDWHEWQERRTRWAWICMVEGALEATMLVQASQVNRPAWRGLTLLGSFAEVMSPWDHGARDILSIGTREQRILPQQSVQCTVRPNHRFFRPERLFIVNSDRWLIHDIKLGNRSQFNQVEPIRGDAFLTPAIFDRVSFETCGIAMDFVIEASYVGPDPDGEPFSVQVVGDDGTRVSDTEFSFHRGLIDAVRAADSNLRKELADQLGVSMREVRAA